MGILESIRNALGMNVQNAEEFGEDYNPVIWSPTAVSPGENIRIEYQGLLKDSGADTVYLHYGFDNWNSPIQTIKMDRKADGEYEANLRFEGQREMNFCFKDSAGNWDNNSKYNWTVYKH